jgi:hypothetical protein
MEVKTKTSSLRVTEPADSAPRLQRPIHQLATTAVKPVQGDPDVRVALPSSTEERTETLSATNQVIGVINVAQQITDNIDGIVRLVAGLAAQMSDESLSSNRRTALQTEALEAVKTLRDRSFAAPPPQVGGTLDQAVREELERTLGRTLEFLVPEQLTTELALGQVDFSTKEAILRTQTAVEVTRQRIERIKDGLNESRDVVKKFLTNQEIALENTRAASSTVRALDQAFDLADAMGLNITAEPTEALDSIGQLGERAILKLQ